MANSNEDEAKAQAIITGKMTFPATPQENLLPHPEGLRKTLADAGVQYDEKHFQTMLETRRQDADLVYAQNSYLSTKRLVHVLGENLLVRAIQANCLQTVKWLVEEQDVSVRNIHVHTLCPATTNTAVALYITSKREQLFNAN
jgi:hypothetical protein